MRESDLLERAKAYDEVALAELYDRYAPRVYAYIYRRVSDAALAEDLTGDVFLRVLQAIQSQRFWHTSFPTWLYRIAHNLVVDHYRRQSKGTELALDERLVAAEEDPVSAVARQLSHERLGVAISHLTSDQQQVLALRFGEGLTAREVAQVLDKSAGAVEALQTRALAALRRVLRVAPPPSLDGRRGGGGRSVGCSHRSTGVCHRSTGCVAPVLRGDGPRGAPHPPQLQ